MWCGEGEGLENRLKEECRVLERMCDFGEGYEGGTFWWWGGGAAMGWLTDRWSVMMPYDCGRADWLDESTRVPSRVYGYPFVRQSTKTQLGDQFLPNTLASEAQARIWHGFGGAIFGPDNRAMQCAFLLISVPQRTSRNT